MKHEEEKALKVRKFLKEKYLDWCREIGEVRSQAEFARSLGIRPSSMSQWINALRYPEGENLSKLAIALGDGIFDAMGISHDDSPAGQLADINSVWPDLDPVTREQVIRLVKSGLGRGDIS